jgi:primosomal protein N' (replication factor Y) (superfamily II helicase)
LTFISVAVPVPGLDLLTYRTGDAGRVPAIGARVVVPLGSRVVTGIVVDVGAEPGAAQAIKPIRDILDEGAFIPADVIALARWTAEYYAAGPSEAITAVLPPKTRGARADAHKTVRVAAITAAGLDAIAVSGRHAGPPSPISGGNAGSSHGTAENARLKAFALHLRGYAHSQAPLQDSDRDASPPLRSDDAGGPPQREGRALTRKQRDVLELLAGTADGIPAPQLAQRGFASDTLSRLAAQGFVSLRAERVDRDPFSASGYEAAAIDASRQLTSEQAAAFDRLRALAAIRAFRVALLHGVTGSGKTEIYLRLSAAVRESGRRVLMLVPEIALTPVVASLFRQTFGERVAIQHSGLSDGERHDQWQRIRRGDIDVVVGTRSAVFTPLQHVGLIIVDEEHDASYKQDESPRYNGRDVAIVRGQRAGALVLLGSATPSMESNFHAMAGKYERILLERRVLDRPLAAVTIVDMREEYAADGPDVILSRALRSAMQGRIARREQILILLNRRGFATAVFCRQCAGTLDCPNCSVSLVVHGEGAARRARCHYCNYSMRVPAVCPLCAGPYLDHIGFGTERVEAEVRSACPGARVARLDRDAIRRRGSLTALLSKFRDGEIDVLVGTQMIAKGHDFPRVTLVGVVSADVGLGVADFRASERTFQLLTQVSGRAGRGEHPGEAIVQTLYPDHYSIQLACRQDYATFYEKELLFRRAMRYPPFTSVVNTIVRARTFAGAMDDAADLVQKVRAADADRDQLRVFGPAPAPIGKLRGEYRAQLLIKSTHRKKMREALQRAVADRPELARRTTIDIDPLSVL